MIEGSSKAQSSICKILDWDSRFFDFCIAECHSIQNGTIQEVLDWCRLHGARCLYLRIPSNDQDQVNLAQNHGFAFVDLRVTFELSPIQASDAAAIHPEFSARAAREQDIPLLRDIAGCSHEDSRFYMDEHFPREKCRQLYETWIENSCKGYSDCVLVPTSGNSIAGYVTCHIDPDSTGRIGLFAIDKSHQGKGIGRALLAVCVNWFADRGCRTVTVATQGRNIQAQRLYQRFGFRTKSIDLWFHKWFDWKSNGPLRDPV